MLRDGAAIHVKDWGTGRPVVFSHAWPLSSDAFDPQMRFLAARGLRCVAHDRRGHGRSSRTLAGHDMDTYADDLHELLKAYDLRDAILVGHGAGGGEVVRYLGRYGSERVSKVALIGAIPPLMLRTKDNPEGTPIETFDRMRESMLTDRAGFFRDFAATFFGCEREGADAATREAFVDQGMRTGLTAAYFGISALSETDLTDDLRRVDVPALVIHGGDDRFVPVEASALKAARLIRNTTLKIYQGASHGLCATHTDWVNEDLLDFITG
ncbi:alpha/beta hydrolase [Salinarimonas soli]|uniref:Alpha/beta hydrolase n=1 Tax=Salinarimonas soli TaxID=1638099 RepID=A0A5B2VH63_9HYPH|nr:alpha/beta hydrolase [Salinarimonas soli]